MTNVWYLVVDKSVMLLIAITKLEGGRCQCPWLCCHEGKQESPSQTSLLPTTAHCFLWIMSSFFTACYEIFSRPSWRLFVSFPLQLWLLAQRKKEIICSSPPTPPHNARYNNSNDLTQIAGYKLRPRQHTCAYKYDTWRTVSFTQTSYPIYL